jgi:protein disulfide-isomerase A1
MDNGVMVLTDANFDEELAKNELLLVEFYAPWCGHCKKLTPEYEGAAEVLSKNDPPVALAKVDATAEKTLAERFGIQGFPTLFWFKGGVKSEYTGGRTKDTIVQWIVKKSGPPSSLVTCDALKAKTDDASTKFLIAYFGAEDTALYTEAHVPYANAEDKIVFVHAELSCQEQFGLSGDAKIVFFRQFEEKVNAYSGAADKDALIAFVKPLMVPTVFEFSEDEIEAIFGNQQNTAILFRDPADKDADFMKTYEEAAKTHKGKVLFAYSGITDGIQERLAEFMGVTKEHLPVLRIIMPADMKKFQHPGAVSELTVESIGSYVQDVLDGKVKPFLKSEAPVDNTGKPVSVVVGENFEEIVKDETKDVLVKYYAPWCGHCKKLAPIWDELGEFYKDQPDLVIAKFDATANEADGVEIRGYPTLIFYPKNNKAGVDYSGEREIQNFKDWLAENSPALKGGSGDGHEQEL